MLEDAKHMLQDWLAWPQHDEASFVPVVLRGILKTPGKIGKVPGVELEPVFAIPANIEVVILNVGNFSVFCKMLDLCNDLGWPQPAQVEVGQDLFFAESIAGP